MARVKEPIRRSSARSAEAREKEVIAAAYDLAEKQIREGTASSQVISHFLKLGSTRDRLEKELLEEKKKLMAAKTEAIESEKELKALYKDALDAMRTYAGVSHDDGFDDYDDEDSEDY